MLDPLFLHVVMRCGERRLTQDFLALCRANPQSGPARPLDYPDCSGVACHPDKLALIFVVYLIKGLSQWRGEDITQLVTHSDTRLASQSGDRMNGFRPLWEANPLNVFPSIQTYQDTTLIHRDATKDLIVIG